MRFKIDLVSLIVERKFTVFALFYFVFEGNFQVQAPGGAYIWKADLTEGFLRYEFGGLIFGGAYTRRSLFLEFYGILCEQIYSRNPRCTSPRASGVVLPVSAVMRSAISFCYQRQKNKQWCPINLCKVIITVFHNF